MHLARLRHFAPEQPAPLLTDKGLAAVLEERPALYPYVCPNGLHDFCNPAAHLPAPRTLSVSPDDVAELHRLRCQRPSCARCTS
jgi:hypothetical protein